MGAHQAVLKNHHISQFFLGVKQCKSLVILRDSLKSVMVWVGSTMTPVERAELLWPKHKFKIRWSEKIRKHGWILWCIYVWLHDLRWFKFSNALLIYVVHYSEPDTWNILECIEIYRTMILKYVLSKMKEKTRHKTNQNHPLFSSTRCDSSFHFSREDGRGSGAGTRGTSEFFFGRRHVLLSFVSVFFLKAFFYNKNNSQQSYFDTSRDECIMNDAYI